MQIHILGMGTLSQRSCDFVRKCEKNWYVLHSMLNDSALQEHQFPLWWLALWAEWCWSVHTPLGLCAEEGLHLQWIPCQGLWTFFCTLQQHTKRVWSRSDFVFWWDIADPEYPWRDQTSLICHGSAPKQGMTGLKRPSQWPRYASNIMSMNWYRRTGQLFWLVNREDLDPVVCFISSSLTMNGVEKTYSSDIFQSKLICTFILG